MNNRYLGIDYGLVHIGLAVAEHMLATPLPSLKNSPTLIASLSELIAEHQVTHIILGLPTGPLVAEISKFKETLQNATSLPVILHDETLSSKEAERQLIASGAKRSKKRDEHSYAAAIILEDYLESVTLS